MATQSIRQSNASARVWPPRVWPPRVDGVAGGVADVEWGVAGAKDAIGEVIQKMTRERESRETIARIEALAAEGGGLVETVLD